MCQPSITGCAAFHDYREHPCPGVAYKHVAASVALPSRKNTGDGFYELVRIEKYLVLGTAGTEWTGWAGETVAGRNDGRCGTPTARPDQSGQERTAGWDCGQAA